MVREPDALRRLAGRGERGHSRVSREELVRLRVGLLWLHRQGRGLFYAASSTAWRGDSPFIDAGDAIKAIDCNATNALAVAHYEAKGPEAADALACLESRCGLKSVDSAYDAFDKKEPWDEVLS